MQLLTRNTQWPLGFKAFEETLSAKEIGRAHV